MKVNDINNLASDGLDYLPTHFIGSRIKQGPNIRRHGSNVELYTTETQKVRRLARNKGQSRGRFGCSSTVWRLLSTGELVLEITLLIAVVAATKVKLLTVEIQNEDNYMLHVKPLNSQLRQGVPHILQKVM